MTTLTASPLAPTGLDLTICKEICLAHHWRIRYEPAPGNGARFVVSTTGRASCMA